MESNHRQVAYETTALPLSYRDVILVPVVGFELTTYRLQGGCSTTELNRRNWSGREDSNLQPPAPKAGALPLAPLPETVYYLYMSK
jgi:hypothetical protein